MFQSKISNALLEISCLNGHYLNCDGDSHFFHCLFDFQFPWICSACDCPSILLWHIMVRIFFEQGGIVFKTLLPGKIGEINHHMMGAES